MCMHVLLARVSSQRLLLAYLFITARSGNWGGSEHCRLQMWQRTASAVAQELHQRRGTKAAGVCPVQSSVLRAVVSPRVVKQAGQVLRSGSGGSEATFNLSQPVDEIDIFLSHSWRDSGLLKYLALCLHFNGAIAMVAALISGFVTFFLLRSGKLTLFPFTPFMNVFNDVNEAMHAAGFHPSYDLKQFPWMDPTYKPIYAPSCQLVATSVFVIVLLLGHHLRAPVTMFLDKVCIHQTDPQRKAAGIQAIDQFLVRSKKMLICYNDDYFERLWCCFELAARASSGSKIEMLPLWRAPVVLVVLVGFTVSHIVEYLYLLFAGVGGSPNGFLILSITFHLIPTLFMIEYTVLATRQKLKLTDTLRSFKIANTKCFDPSDRSVVEQAISSWFADGGEPEGASGWQGPAGVDLRAIERFECDVRGGMTHRMIMSSVGKQPGLLRVHDLLLIFYTIWIPTGLDFSVKGVGRGNEMVLTFVIFVTPIAQGLAFIAVASVASALFRIRTDWPKWLLYVLLCFIFFAVMLIILHAIFIFIFGICQTACIVPVPW